MKKSIVISVQPTKFSALAFKEDLEVNIKKIATLGYDGVELAVRDPQSLNIEKIVQFVKDYNLEVPAIGTGQAWGEEGLSLSDPNEKVRKMAVDRITEQIKFASHFNAQVIIGLIRGTVKEGKTKKETEERALTSLKECAEFAEEYNILLTMEPVNRYESNFINTLEEGIEFIEKVNSPNVKLLADTFHMNVEEVSIYDSLIQAKEYISHLHFADSNRWAPGFGHLDFEKIVKTLAEISYQGYVSAEILPMPDQDKAAEKTIETLKKLNL